MDRIGNVYKDKTIVGSHYSCCPPESGKPDVVWRQIFPEKHIIEMLGRSCLTACIKSSYVELPDLYLDCFQTHPPKIIERIVVGFNLSHATKEIETLKKIDRAVLSQMPLALLTYESIRQWLIQNLSAADHEIWGMSIKDFSDLDWPQRRVLLKRVECIEKKGIPKGNFQKNSLGMIRQMKANEFFAQFPHVPPYALELLTKSQREQCDFSQISADTLRRLADRADMLFSPIQKQKIEQHIALDDIAKETRVTETLRLLEKEALEEQLSIARQNLHLIDGKDT